MVGMGGGDGKGGSERWDCNKGEGGEKFQIYNS